MHILVFLVAVVLAVTFAHPSMFITDEWVTLNQVSQLHDGHQILYNEGKYGSLENGTPTIYFTNKHNYLAYPLFLPLLSLPAYWLLDLFGNNFLYFIIYLLTFLLIALALTLNTLFPEYTHIGKWRWTTGFIVGIFVIFFVNLDLYRTFSFTGSGSYPEVAAVVLTEIILFSFLAVMIYEICQTIFENPEYALFGTLTCISCSSYLFWTSFCKDHILVAFLVTAIVFLLVKLWYTEKPVYLAAAFGTCGLLAWARPEVALGIAIALSVLVLYIWLFMKNCFSKIRDRQIILLYPVFTFVGAIPFFINNYLLTRNIFVPTVVLWANTSSSYISSTGSAITPQSTPGIMESLQVYILGAVSINPSTFFTDLYGVFFNPHSGSIGVFPIIPIFFVAILLVPALGIGKEIWFTKKEYQVMGILLLISLGVFIAYSIQIASMNNEGGITPDIRYLSPLYLPLTLIGLLIIRKIPALSDRPRDLIIGMITVWIILIPSLLMVIGHFTRSGNWFDVFHLLNGYISVGIYLLAILFLLTTIYNLIFHKTGSSARIFLILLCSLPLVWQITITFTARTFAAGMGGYSFWIPIIMKWYALIFIY
jgi:hypothetical protein